MFTQIVHGKEPSDIMNELFVSGFLLSLSLCLDLGIVNIAVIKTGLERGVLPSFMVGLGSSFGDLIYAILSMVGMSLLLQFTIIRWILWLGGSAFLLYLSFNMLKITLRPKISNITIGNSINDKSRLNHLMIGAGLALSSPSAILWFAAVGGSVIAATTRHFRASDALVIFFMGFFFAGILWSFVLAYVSGKARKMMGTRLTRFLSLTSAVLFIYFAFRVFFNGLYTLL